MLALLVLTAVPTADDSQFFAYLQRSDSRMIGYSAVGLDPRQPANNTTHRTEDFRTDLVALRPAFDGLVLYGYHEASTPRLLATAVDLGYEAVLLAIWQPRSSEEVDGVVRLCRQYGDRIALAVAVGNEGLWFDRYSAADVRYAGDRIRRFAPGIPIATSEPFISYDRAQPNQEFVRSYGDFLAPNIHPVFDRPEMPATAAAKWAREQATTLAAESGLPVLLKETGFPHAGKPMYTLESQAEFWRSFLEDGTFVPATPSRPWVSLAAGFESFDSPWKSEASGLPMERSWGLMDETRQPYPAFVVWKDSRVDSSR